VTFALLPALLFGAALGLRFRVYALIPASIIVATLGIAGLVTTPRFVGWSVAEVFTLLAALNIGYALGVFLRAGAAAIQVRKISALFKTPSRQSDAEIGDPTSRHAADTARQVVQDR
jgi:hypothetical protein